MLCHAYAFLPVSTNHSGTSCLARIASPSAARSSSSSRTLLAPRPVDVNLTLYERGHGAGLAEPFQAAGTLRADASHRDLQGRADLRVRHRRVFGEHGQQLLI